MNYLTIAKNKIKTLIGTNVVKVASDISDKSDKRVPEVRFTSVTDPYRDIGARQYWQKHVPPEMRPQWVREIYALK